MAGRVLTTKIIIKSLVDRLANVVSQNFSSKLAFAKNRNSYGHYPEVHGVVL
jgi:hypothetical protein